MTSITINNIDNYDHNSVPADLGFNTHKCWARLNSNKSKQCNNRPKCNHFCGVHHSSFLKGKLLTIFDDLGINLANSEDSSITSKTSIPSIDYSNRDYSIFLNNIMIIQKILRGFLVRLNIKHRGIATYCRHICNNDTDCLTLKDINEIPNKEFYSFKDSNGHYWGFDIVTIKECINNKVGNPYNTMPFDKKIISDISRIEKKTNKKIKLVIPKITNIKVSIQQRCVELFQKMDDLKNYTKCAWFLDLELNGLYKLYKEMEDMWNYRLNLSSSDKLNYVKSNDINLYTLKEFGSLKKITNKYSVSNIILDSFEKLICDGKTESDRATACQWILSGLTLVHQDARDTLPWLYQSAHY